MFKIFKEELVLGGKKLKLETSGFRIISNTGINANQEVPHFHVHILGGENLGGIISK